MQNMYLSQQSASMRYLFIWLIGLLPGLALAQSLSIGRSTLTLPDPLRWQVHDLPDISLGYTGDKSGSFTMEAKRLVFRSSTFSSKAVAMLGVTKGGGWRYTNELDQHLRQSPSFTIPLHARYIKRLSGGLPARGCRGQYVGIPGQDAGIQERHS